MWRIYYADGSHVDGWTQEEWQKAPHKGVQVVVLFARPEKIRWHSSRGPVRDRQLWTGEPEYDPFGWGKKRGSLIPKRKYFEIWERACSDER